MFKWFHLVVGEDLYRHSLLSNPIDLSIKYLKKKKIKKKNWALRNTSSRIGGPNLGLNSKRMSIRWFGKRGMLWGELGGAVAQARDRFPPPSLLLIQLGSNDLTA